jgi:hypothetical protein
MAIMPQMSAVPAGVTVLLLQTDRHHQSRAEVLPPYTDHHLRRVLRVVYTIGRNAIPVRSGLKTVQSMMIIGEKMTRVADRTRSASHLVIIMNMQGPSIMKNALFQGAMMITK